MKWHKGLLEIIFLMFFEIVDNLTIMIMPNHKIMNQEKYDFTQLTDYSPNRINDSIIFS